MATACERAERTAFMQNFDIHGIRFLPSGNTNSNDLITSLLLNFI
jgi:hypothetical protein